MGRYYKGDIEGKFMFGIQSSDDADFFGGYKDEPHYIEYSFFKEHIPVIKEVLKKCDRKLEGYTDKIKEITKRGYTDEELEEGLGVSRDKVNLLLEWYARRRLGKQILKRVEETGECIFTAEI